MDFERLNKDILDLDTKIRFVGVCDESDALTTKVGRGRYAMAEYEKINRLTFPSSADHVMLAKTEVNANHMEIIINILKRLENSIWRDESILSTVLRFSFEKLG